MAAVAQGDPCRPALRPEHALLVGPLRTGFAVTRTSRIYRQRKSNWFRGRGLRSQADSVTAPSEKNATAPTWRSRRLGGGQHTGSEKGKRPWARPGPTQSRCAQRAPLDLCRRLSGGRIANEAITARLVRTRFALGPFVPTLRRLTRAPSMSRISVSARSTG
jgi:hypothetical protein